MDKNAKDYIKEIISFEGFHYAMDEYSYWEEIDDAHFQKLLAEYKEALNNLKNYIFE